jgi:demethylmenaquinone methyltransferase/2-methoxy-6-polyprenyl-1,4-benzoquinol methylase
MGKLRHFDWLAPVYEKIIGGEDSRILLNLLDLKPDQWILDAGGGTGRIAASLFGEGRKVFVADLSFQMLRQAFRKNGLRCSACDVRLLPFLDKSFDRIIIVDAFHHFADQPVALSELWRVLRPGGMLMIEEPDISHLSVKLIALLEKALLMQSKFLKSNELEYLIRYFKPSKVMVYNENYSYWLMAIK